ncbi:MAG: hypothetical protein EB150_07085 [Nitrososphaeria archaeon]|nr:hypothetical protein [Nitrososphaeria archaeon]NDB51925.1 hypothetical protein [Nitrosopumilaceae archaeon]NDF25558.1 hypothetical protein [Nitrososphaerota archaeon]NDB47153.1 hypothetical protein [Nitrososphaeria archaeon]NDB92047.1 hypothetical protein [Nitrososphaeria archaeon]
MGNSTDYVGRTFILLLTGVGLILFWRGIWQMSEELFSKQISLILGLVIIISIAIYEKKQIFKSLSGTH